jgi:hypothetical protein
MVVKEIVCWEMISPYMFLAAENKLHLWSLGDTVRPLTAVMFVDA